MLKVSLILLGVMLIFQAQADRMVAQIPPYNDLLCARFNSDGTICLECAYHAFYDNTTGVCTNVDDSCKSWDRIFGECLTCFDGYGDGMTNGQAINGTCPLYNSNITNQNCQCYNGNTCISCMQGFYLDINDYCQAGILGCKNHNVGNQTANSTVPNLTCLQCGSSYHLTTQGTCVWIPPFCSYTQNNGTCSRCFQGYQLNSVGDCVILAKNCVQSNLNGDQCILCEGDFFVNFQAECISIPTNCQQVDSSGNCTVCAKGFGLNATSSTKNTCVSLPTDCVQADATLNCIKCDWGFQLKNGTCTTLIDNCAQAINGKCKFCLPGFVVDKQNNCLALTDGCLTGRTQNITSNITTCNQCLPGWALTSNGDCFQSLDGCATQTNTTANSTCNKCIMGYYLDSNDKCQYLTDNCQQTDTNGICTRCMDAYVLDVFSTCRITPGFGQNSTSTNQTINLDCYAQDPNGICTQCRPYYNLTNGTCVPSGENPLCFLYDSGKTCLGCYYPEKFILDNNYVCFPGSLYCNAYSVQTGLCLSCYNGWFLIDGYCINQLETMANMTMASTPKSKRMPLR